MNDLDQSTISRLANIKGIHEHTLLLLENPTPLEGALALVLMDSILESIFKLALDEHEVQEDKRIGRYLDFPTLLEKVLQDKELEKLKKYRLSLSVLHKARNGFQHDGIIPDLNTVLREYKPLTEHALRSISKLKFGLGWEDVSLSLLIRDETIKRLYRKAEQSFINGHYTTATAYLIYTFEIVKKTARTHIIGSGLSLYRPDIKKADYKDNLLVKYLLTLDEEIETFKLGLDYVDLRYYFDMASFVGINTILYDIPDNTAEEAIIEQFKGKLEKNVILKETEYSNPMKEWYINMREPILKFIIRTETHPKPTLQRLYGLIKRLTERINTS